jgi:hypothetical protein
MGKLIDRIGRQYGRLIVVEREGVNEHGATVWKCKCACGRWAYVTTGNLQSEHTQSCGCLRRDATSAANRLEPFRSRYNALVGRCRAARRKVMSYRSYLRFTKIKQCYYCHDPIRWIPFGGHVGGSNLDRVDSRLGYEKRNCVVCCGHCNTMKLAMTQRQFFAKIARIFRIHGDGQ